MRTMAKMKPVMKITCNPEYSCYLRKWLQAAGYLDEKNHGIPLPEMDGVEKWFIRQGNDMIWGDSEESMHEQYGDDCGAMSFRFISAKCTDNPVLLKHDPQYENRLKSLPRIERMRLLDGAWLVQETAAGHYKKEWTTPIMMNDIPPLVKVVRAYDLAGSIPSEKYPDPDFTASCLMGVDEHHQIYILDIKRFRKRYAGVVDEIIEQGLQDKLDWGDVTTYIPEDPSSSGKAACAQMLGDISSHGVLVKKMKTANVKNRKLRAFQPFAVAAENEMVNVVKEDWNEMFHEELEVFDPNVRISGIHDDIVDATADAFLQIKTSKIRHKFTGVGTTSSSSHDTMLHKHKSRIS